MAISRDLDSGFNYSHHWGFHPLSVVVLVFLYVVKVCNIRCKGVYMWKEWMITVWPEGC